jgi:hypothetical protein
MGFTGCAAMAQAHVMQLTELYIFNTNTTTHPKKIQENVDTSTGTNLKETRKLILES